MKINNILSRGLLLAMAVTASFAFTACEDEPDKYEVGCGTPTISYVRTPYLSQRDSLITAASTGSPVCFVGDNLRSITKILFNDQQAILNTSYMTDHTLIVDVPKTIPETVTDKVYFVTASNDTIPYDFAVTVPAPEMNEMSCEYAKAGDLVTITGDYFVTYDDSPFSIEMPDGQKVTEFKSLTQNSISFILPECTVEGPLVATSKYGTAESNFHYLESRGLLFDFDGTNGIGTEKQGWHEFQRYTDDTSLAGYYIQLGDGTYEVPAASVDENKATFEYWCGSWDSPQNITSGSGIALYNIVDFTNFKKMALKFEMNIPASNPWMAEAMQICFMGVDKVSLGGDSNNANVHPITGFDEVYGPNNWAFFGSNSDEDWNALTKWGRALYRPWTTSGSYDTAGKWITVTIPIKDFSYDKDGGAAETVLSKVTDFASLDIHLCGGGVSGKTCKPIIKIDNIRVVPYK